MARGNGWRVAAALAVALLGSACGDDGEITTAAAEDGHTVEELSAEQVGFGESLAQIRGHHRVSLELYEDGDAEGAVIHAEHPVSEILAAVTSELDEHAAGTSDELASALAEGPELIGSGAEPSELAAAYDRVADLTAGAEAAVVGDAATSSSYTGSVVSALLGTAGHEYEEAVAGGNGVQLLEEYQDGYAFVLEAEELYSTIEQDVRDVEEEEAEEIEEAFTTLKAALPGPTPPADLADVADVEAAADLIAHELEETVHALPLEDADPEEIAQTIEELLDEIVALYAAGDAEAAAELSAEAYLENYEVIEAQVIAEAPEINEELEPLLGAELRRRIQDGAPAEDIEAMVARAKELLTQALEALEGN